MKLQNFNHEGVAVIVFNQNIKSIFKTEEKRRLAQEEKSELKPKDIFTFDLIRDG